MPRVLRILNRFNLGGPSYNAAYLTRHLAPEFETLLVGGDKEPGEDSSLFIFEEMGLQPVILPEMNRSVNIFQDLNAYRRIKQLIRDFKPDIVHTHAAKAGAVGRLAAYHCRVPVIIHTFHGHVFHSYFGKAKTSVFKSIERYLAKRSTAIIAISDKQKQELCSEHHIAPQEKVHVIPLGFDLTRFTEKETEKRHSFRSKYQIAEDEIVVVIIGRLAPVKNHPLFIRSFARLRSQTKQKVRAVIVGDGTIRGELELQCRQAGLSTCYWPEQQNNSDVIFTSWITDVSYPLAASDIVCLTSYNEGTPVSLIEAQAASRPIVTTRVGGIENAVSPDAGFLVHSGDEQAFSEKLLFLVENPDKRREMQGAAVSFALSRFSYERLVKDTRALYLHLLSERQ